MKNESLTTPRDKRALRLVARDLGDSHADVTTHDQVVEDALLVRVEMIGERVADVQELRLFGGATVTSKKATRIFSGDRS